MTTDSEPDRNVETRRRISKAGFYFDTPLYDELGYDEIEDDLMKGDVDGYNPIGGFETTFHISADQVGTTWTGWSQYYAVNKDVYLITTYESALARQPSD